MAKKGQKRQLNYTGDKPDIMGEKEKFVPFGSPEHEAMLAAGYGMTREEAEAIIQEREANPVTHPYDVYKRAKALLAALVQKPIAIDTDPGWERDRSQIR